MESPRLDPASDPDVEGSTACPRAPSSSSSSSSSAAPASRLTEAHPEPEQGERERIKAIADEASAYLKGLNVAAVPSWLLKLYGLTAERPATKGPWGTRERQA